MTETTRGLFAGWRKSRHSVGHDAGNCAEVGTVSGTVAVRDTTDRDGRVLSFPVQAWTRFTAAVKR